MNTARACRVDRGPASASASACARSTTSTSSAGGRASTGSRRSPRTTSTPAAGRCMSWNGCAATTPWRCTAWRCRSVRPIRSTGATCADLRALIERIEPALVTDHLCWTGVDGRSLYDLLPLPVHRGSLAHVVARVRRVQDVLGRRIALENPSTYVAFRHSTMSEWEFLAALAEQADCGILLDVNNVYVSAHNLGFDPLAYLDAHAAPRAWRRSTWPASPTWARISSTRTARRCTRTSGASTAAPLRALGAGADADRVGRGHSRLRAPARGDGARRPRGGARRDPNRRRDPG